MKKRNKLIELLLNIYILYKEINNKIQKSLQGSYGEYYYIINKEWINNFLEEFKFRKEFLKIDNIVNRNENQNFTNIKENKIDDKIIDDIMNKLSKDYIEEINEKINNENTIKKISNIELYALKLEKKNI